MIKKCYDCGVVLTKENDSGWEIFTGYREKSPSNNQDYIGVTAPLCKSCNEKRNNMPKIKAKL